MCSRVANLNLYIYWYFCMYLGITCTIYNKIIIKAVVALPSYIQYYSLLYKLFLLC